MQITRWKITIVDGGDFHEYVKEVALEGYCQSYTMLQSLDHEIGDMYPNSIHSLKVEYLGSYEN